MNLPLTMIQVDTDKLIVSESVKEVRPCVAERFDNDHRRELAEQCISFDSTADEDKPDEPDIADTCEVTGMCLFACVYVQSC